MLYRKKTQDVQAMAVDDIVNAMLRDTEQLPDWIGKALAAERLILGQLETLMLKTSNGRHYVNADHMIMRYDDGALGVCRKDTFQENYEKVEKSP